MKKSPLIESIYSKLVNERVTDIVYHGTGLIELRQILEQDKIMTSVAQGVRSDSKLNKDKFFFFSTARSVNTFREAFGLPQKAAVMVLDGRKLSQRYKAAAVDYWGPGFLDQDETEDRIVTDDPYIEDFSQYIKEVRILFPVKSFRSVSHAENNSIEKSLDILKAKGIPVKILTKEKYFFINNPKDYMTTKEEWAEFLKKSGYSIGEKRPEDDVGTNLRKATPFNDSANLAELIKMVENGNLDFSVFPSNDKVTQIKNDLYKHLVDPDGDGVEPKYSDDEDEKIKNRMLKGQQVISAQQIQDMYNQIVFYPRDFSTSVGTSIQNSRKNPDARENLTVISKYMRKNKLKDLETLGVFLKTRINAIKDGRMQKVAESILNKILEKKYNVDNTVLWSASYSEMIEFANTGDFFIPLGEDFLKRALGTEPTKGSVFHVTDYRGVYGLLNMQGKKKAVAGFTSLGDTVADKMFTRGVGAGRSSGFVVELEGDVLTSFFRDARTRPEKGGRRNVKLVTLQKSIGRQGFMKVRKEILQKLHQYNEKMGAKSKIPPQEKIPQGQDASVVLDAWRKQIVRAQKPGPRMIKRYKEQGKPIPKGDGKKFAEMIKYYLDAVEEVVKNNQEMFKKAIIDANMGEKGGYTGYDEKNIEKFRVKNVFLVKGSPAAEEVGDTNLPADLEKEGVGYMPGMSQDQMLQYVNSAQQTNEDIQQRIYNKIAEKSAKKYRGVMNQESYGDMIEFDSALEMFIPLGSSILKRVVGDLPENVKGFHISNLEGAANLFNIEGTTKAISTFTRGAKPKFIKDGITGRGGVVVELEGRLITSSLKDVFSLPEKGGRRNILLGNLRGLIGDDAKSKEIVDDLVSGIKKWVDNNTEGDNTIALNTWNEKVRSADGKQKQEMVKYYLDLAESVMKKHSKTIEYALLNPFKSSVSNYDAMDIYDENVMDRFKVKGVYFVDKYYKKRGMVDFPTDEEFKKFISDMNKKGIEVMSGTAKELADMVNSSLGKDGATKYFEEVEDEKDDDWWEKRTIQHQKDWEERIRKSAIEMGLDPDEISEPDFPSNMPDGSWREHPDDEVDDSVEIFGTDSVFDFDDEEEDLTEAGGDLSYLLLPVGQTQQIGAEKQDKKTKDGIERYSNKFGSYRYVMMMDGEPVGAIQVMSRDKSKGVAANVFVKPEYRRKGIAKKLLVQAKKDFDEVEYNPDQSDDGKAWVSSVAESIYKKITKESQDPSTLSSIWNVVERRDLSRLTQMMLSDDACCDTETISGLWDESDPQDAMFYLLPEPEWREWDDSDYEDEEDWTEKEMEKRREHNKGISMEEIYKSREELGQISRELLARDGIAQKSPDGSGAVIKVWRCGVTEGQTVTSVTWSEQYAYKFCTGKKVYNKDDTEVDAYYINLQDVLVSIPHIWESGYREWELLVHPKDLVSVQGYKRLDNLSERIYNKILKGL